MSSLLRRWFSPKGQVRKPIRRRPRPTQRLALETLEDRTAPAVVTVNTLADDTGADAFLTLREAITLVNAGTAADPGNDLGRALTAQELAQVEGVFGTSDTIRFESSPGVDLVGTINLSGELPFLDAAAAIEGPGADLLAVSGRGEIRVLHVGARFIGTVSGLTLRDGPGDSGVLIQNVGRLTLVDCVVGPTNGTGLLNQHESILTLNRVTVQGANRGIDNFGNVELTSCTVSGNTNYGLYQQSHFLDSAIVRHSTFTGNASGLVVLDAPAAGGIEVIPGAEAVLLEHTVVAGNFRSSYNPETLLITLVPSDVRGEFTPGSRFNLIGVDGGITAGLAHADSGNQVGTSATPIDALLGLPADNGGATPTHALLPGSPALNAGDPAFVPLPSVDQRGRPRVFGGRIDIGAVEDQSAPPPPQGPVIQGQHFLDLDDDGKRDPGEPGLDGWTVQLRDESGNVIAEDTTHAIDHDASGIIEPETERGFYRFTRVEPGNYVVSIVPRSSASQTFPRELHFGARTDATVDNGPVTLAKGDFTGDGVTDIAVVSQLARTITVLRNLGDGTYVTHSTTAVGAAPTAIAAADLDRDGDIDLAVTLGNATVVILRNNGQGVFTVAAPLAVGNDPLAIVAADLDEDGDADLAVANFTPGTVSVLTNEGAGIFTRNDVRVGRGPGGIAAADLEGDGRIDLFVSNFFDGTISVMRNSVRFAGVDTHSAGGEARSVAAADLDGDGDPDLAVATTTGVFILRNNGNRTFAAPRQLEGVSDAQGIQAADLDNDGDIDLVFANTLQGRIGVLTNNGAAAFAAPDFISVVFGSRSPLPADLDGDGRLDLAVANFNSLTVSTLRNLFGKHQVAVAGPDDDHTGLDFGTLSRVQVVSGVRPELIAAEGSRLRVPVQYTTTDDDRTLSGLGVRLHFDSRFMTFDGLSNLLDNNFSQQQVLADTQDFDGDPATDSYVLVSWADLRGQWPERMLPTRLFDAHFRLTDAADIGDETRVRFTASSTAVTHGFAGIPIDVEVVPASLDVDQNGVADALSDGQMIVRSLFGFSGRTLTRDAVALNATRTDPALLEAYLEQIQSILDVDDNGIADAMTDGALVQRYLFGFRGAALTEGVVDPAGARTDPAAIVAFLDQFNPQPLALSDATSPSPLAFSLAAATGRQVVTLVADSQDIASGAAFRIDVPYATDPPAALVGLGLRLHYDSRAVEIDALDRLHAAGTPLFQVADDISDFDNDPATDKYLLSSYFDLLGGFPAADEQTPATLYRAHFIALPSFTGAATFRVTASSTALGYTLDASPDGLTVDVSAPETVNWVSDTSGFWDDAANWSTGRLPRPGDRVVIDRPGADVTVTARTAGIALQDLRSTEALDLAAGAIEVRGDAHIEHLTVRAGALFRVIDGAVGPCNFENFGVLEVLGGRLQLHEGDMLLNRAGGVIDIVPGGGDPGLEGGGIPGSELEGGGDPGMPAPGGGIPGFSADGASINNAGVFRIFGGAMDLTDGQFINDAGGVIAVDVEGGGVPGMPAPGGGIPGLEGGGDPGISAIGTDIANFGAITVGRPVSLAGGATLTNHFGGTFGVDVADGGAEPPGAGGSNPGGDGSGGGAEPPGAGGNGGGDGSGPSSGGGATPNGAGLSADGSTVDNAGGMSIRNGALFLTGNAVFINRPTGIVEMPAPDDSGTTPGGGIPGQPAPSGDPLPPSLVESGSLLENQADGAVDFGIAPLNVSGAFINSGLAASLGGINVLPGGDLAGIGVIEGNLFNAGLVRPGLSPGVLTVIGDYLQAPGGVLELEVGGTSAGVNHDQLRVTGTTVLGGDLRLVLVGNFVPGQASFPLLQAPITVGAFAGTSVIAPDGSRLLLDLSADGRATFRPRPPAIAQVIVNRGRPRTPVKRVLIQFSEPVSIGPGAFQLRHKSGAVVTLKVKTRNAGGKTIAVLTFPETQTLPQGAYRLTIRAALVKNQRGLALDGNLDGIAGDNVLARFASVHRTARLG